MPIVYKEIKLEQGYRMDLLVEDKVVIELKTVDFLTDERNYTYVNYYNEFLTWN
jgi:GxxExxY protein